MSAATAVAEYRAPRGQRLAFKLPDGTSVVLGPASTLRVGPTYGRAAREVALVEGEAYFEVTHDAARPFSVRVTDLLVRDLGTRFVVRAYREDRVAEVVVTGGAVALGRPPVADSAGPLSSDSLLLEPGQRGRLTESGALELTPGVSLDEYVGWTEGRLVFHDTPLSEVLQRVSRWYDIPLRLADTTLAARTLTASFRDEPASEVVRLIAVSLGVRVEREGAVFVLSAVRKS